MKKKVVALVLCMVMLVAVSVTGTLAYLTANDSVSNTFTVGKVAMTMDESNQAAADPATAPRVDHNEYKLMPGSTYTKDPIVHLTANSEACYLIIKVDNGLANIEDGTTIDAQIKANGWTPVTAIGYTGYYIRTVDAATAKTGDNFNVFNSFTITGNIDNDGLDAYKTAKIDVKAFAIQSEGVNEATALQQAAARFAE